MRTADIAADVAGLEALVTAEDAAVFGVSGIGGRVTYLTPASPASARLRDLYDAHRLRRDRWAGALTARRGRIPDAAPAYVLPAMPTAAAAIAAAADLEARCAQAYRAALDEVVDVALRGQVVPCLVDAARQAYALGLLGGRTPAQASSALPGS